MNHRRVKPQSLRAFATALMQAHGVDAEQAQSVGENMTWTDQVGRPNQGMSRLPALMDRYHRGLLSSPCRARFTSLAPAVERLDGDAGFGHHVGALGMRRAIALAHMHGVGIVGTHNSNFFGAGAYYVNLAALDGMIGLAASNSFPKVAAHGGLRAVLGTNPFAFGAPGRDGRGIIVDMATSALAGSTVRDYMHKKMPLPEGLAVDGEGRPVTDPAKVGEGVLLPFGGAKGYGLALLVEILSAVLTGAGMSHGVASMFGDFTRSGDNGHFFLALDIARWMPMPAYYDRLDGLVETLHASGSPGQVRLPGALRWQRYDDNLVNGIRLDGTVCAQLEELSRPHGVAPPW